MRVSCFVCSVIAGLAHFCPDTFAFVPKKLYEATATLTRDTESHAQITENALFMVTATFLNSRPQPDSTPISEGKPVSVENMFLAHHGKAVSTIEYIRAVQEVASANANVDFRQDTKLDPTWHFDCELFELGNTGLKKQWQAIYVAVMNGDYSQARSLTGQYLHAMQDFYRQVNKFHEDY